jgi:hypothetical protein
LSNTALKRKAQLSDNPCVARLLVKADALRNSVTLHSQDAGQGTRFVGAGLLQWAAAKSLFENVAAGILACRRGRHPAARKKASPGETLWICQGFTRGPANPPGWKPRLYVSQDGRRYLFQTPIVRANIFGLRSNSIFIRPV